MTRSRYYLLCAFILLALAGITSAEEVSFRHSDEVYGWKGVELSDGSAMLKVVPQNGRIIYWGFQGAGNLLWVNPITMGKTYEQAGEPMFGWANFGGDKIWPIPQEDIPQTGKRYYWPHDKAFEGGESEVRFSDGRLRILTDLSPALGVQGVRNIDFLSKEATLRINQRLKKGNAVKALHYIKTVTQITDPQYVVVPLSKNSWFHYPEKLKNRFPDGVSPLTKPEENWSSFLRINGDCALLNRPEKFKGPCLFYSDNREGWFCAVYEDSVFLQLFKFYNNEYYSDGNNLQVMISPGGYFEMELMSPADMLKPGEEIEFTVIWMLKKLPSKTMDEKSIIRFCRTSALNALERYAEVFSENPIIRKSTSN